MFLSPLFYFYIDEDLLFFCLAIIDSFLLVGTEGTFPHAKPGRSWLRAEEEWYFSDILQRFAIDGAGSHALVPAGLPSGGRFTLTLFSPGLDPKEEDSVVFQTSCQSCLHC